MQAEFLMQRAIAGCDWGEVMPQIEAQTADLTQQYRMLASYHDAGDINLRNDTRSQWANEEVEKRFGVLFLECKQEL
jgi:hypothetical protein